MELFDCIFARRTCRRFGQSPIPIDDLEKIVDAGRYVPSGYNKQPQRFAIVHGAEAVAKVFDNYVGWLFGKAPKGERPVAYVAILNDCSVNKSGVPATHCATYAVMLAAWGLGYGSCWHGVDDKRKDAVREMLGLDENIDPRVFVSLGVPAEEFEVTDPGPWQPKKGDDGVVRLGKVARDESILATI